MSNNNKVKGLLKGLRFISQIFESDEKDSEIQIGNPTDVKHVAHIGLDGQGPSENNPSWMNEFKSVPGNSSAPQNHNGDNNNRSKRSDNSVQRASQGSRHVHSQGEKKEIQELPKSSKRETDSMGNIRESHAKEKSDRARPQKKSSKNSLCDGDKDSMERQGSDLPSKKPRPKMSKEGSNDGGVSSKSRSKPHHNHSRDSNSNNQQPHSGHTFKPGNKHGSFVKQEEEQFQRVSSENMLQSYTN